MEILTPFVMLPVLGWYFYTITDRQRPSCRQGADQYSAFQDRESVQLPRRRRFPRPVSWRSGIEYRSVRGHHQRAGSALAAHPMWDRWIDG
jgi:hypothetical protein